jgi:hypothetical protein
MKKDHTLYHDSDRLSIDGLIEFSCGSSGFDIESFQCIYDTNIKDGGGSFVWNRRPTYWAPVEAPVRESVPKLIVSINVIGELTTVSLILKTSYYNCALPC